MKKLLLSTAILVASLTASAQNVIQHGDFKGVTTMTEAGALYRIANPGDLGKLTQTANPSLTEAKTVTIGNWYKKASNSASLMANVMTDVAYGEAKVNAVNMKKTGNTVANNYQNQLTQFFALTEGDEYTLTFDVKTEDGANNYENMYIELRALVGSQSTVFHNISNFSMIDATYFTDLGNGWLRFSASFKAQDKGITAADFLKSSVAISKDALEKPYSYFVTNVSIEKSTPSSLGSANESKAKVYATGKTVRVENANGTVSVYNVAGQLVKQLVCQENVSFDLSSKGVFVVKVQEANAAKTVKIAL